MFLVRFFANALTGGFVGALAGSLLAYLWAFLAEKAELRTNRGRSVGPAALVGIVGAFAILGVCIVSGAVFSVKREWMISS